MSDELETITIGELTEASSIGANDRFIIENASQVNKKVSPSTVANTVRSNFTTAEQNALASGITPQKVAQYDSLVMQNIFNACHPIGDKYIQYPGDAEPEDLYNVEGVIDSTWEDISEQFAGLFFRVAGGNAEEFNKSLEVATQSGTTLTFATGHGITTGSLLVDPDSHEQRAVTAVSDNTVTIESAFTSSNLTTVLIFQNSGLPNITGTWGSSNSSRNPIFDADVISGAISKDTNKKGQTFQGSAGTGSSASAMFFDASASNSIYGASTEVQTPNSTIRLWKRTA